MTRLGRNGHMAALLNGYPCVRLVASNLFSSLGGEEAALSRSVNGSVMMR